MTSSRPYLLQAFYRWIVDNHLTPYIVVRTDMPGVVVPQDYIEDERIVLNISPNAIQGLVVGNEGIEFSARFARMPYDIYIPIRAVTAIYAKENNRGMIFKEGEEEDDMPPEGSTTGFKGSGKPSGSGRPNLTIVK